MNSGLRLAHCCFFPGLGLEVWLPRAQARGTVDGRKPGSPVLPSSLLPQVVLRQDHETGVRAVTAQCGEPERDLPGTRK